MSYDEVVKLQALHREQLGRGHAMGLAIAWDFWRAQFGYADAWLKGLARAAADAKEAGGGPKAPPPDPLEPSR